MESQGSDNFPIHQKVSAETGFSHKPTPMLGLQAQSCPNEVAVASQEEEKKGISCWYEKNHRNYPRQTGLWFPLG